jgi:hypothetical protein
VTDPQRPPEDGRHHAKDAAAFAGGCLAGLGAVGIVTLTVIAGIVATILVVVLLIFLSCAGVFQ